MTTFRCKTKKQALTGTRETLHSKHLEMIKTFKNVKKTLTQKRKHLKDLQAELAVFEHQEDKTPEDFARVLEMKEEIELCEREIQKIDMNEEEDQYYMTNGDLIFQYFQNIDEIANDAPADDIESNVDKLEDEKPKCVSPKSSKKGKESGIRKPDGPKVTDFWKVNPSPKKSAELPSIPEEAKDDQSPQVDPAPDTVEKKSREGGLHDWIERKENFKRAQMLDKYMSNIDPTHIISVDRVKEQRCPDCDEEMLLNQNEGYTECRLCGYSEEVKVDSDKRSYKEATNTDMSYIAYKRINHFEYSLECKSGLKVSILLVASAA